MMATNTHVCALRRTTRTLMAAAAPHRPWMGNSTSVSMPPNGGCATVSTAKHEPQDQSDLGVPEDCHGQGDERHRQRLGREAVPRDEPSEDEVRDHQSGLQDDPPEGGVDQRVG